MLAPIPFSFILTLSLYLLDVCYAAFRSIKFRVRYFRFCVFAQMPFGICIVVVFSSTYGRASSLNVDWSHSVIGLCSLRIKTIEMRISPSFSLSSSHLLHNFEERKRTKVQNHADCGWCKLYSILLLLIIAIWHLSKRNREFVWCKASLKHIGKWL